MSSAATPGGIVYLVGAGPGDPGLITVRGRQLLEGCDAIVFDALANPLLVPTGPERHDVGKRGGSSESARQNEINRLLVSLARSGKRVVRLKGGDPFVFGRGSEEAQALATAGIRFEVVPGVTAGIAALAYAGIPVTHRGIATTVTFVTGHEDPAKPETQIDWAALARVGSTGTLVLYMGLRTLPSTALALIQSGLPADFPAAAVELGTHPNQRTVVATISTIAERVKAEGLVAPAITVIGRVVDLRDEIAWFESRPLFGKRILVTRATAAAGTLAAQLRELGADAIEAPSTVIEALDAAPLDRGIARLALFDWLVLTSPTAVRFFREGLERAGLDARSLAALKIAVIGPATAVALGEGGLRADIVPERFVAESLLDAFRRESSIQGSRVLYAMAGDARTVLPEGLRELGATVDTIAMYRSRLVTGGRQVDGLRSAIDADLVDLVTFASASAVAGFVAQVGVERASRVKAVSIGPVTTDAARVAGIEVVREATEATISALLEAAKRALQSETVRPA